jgi:WD40-like Beta Propeller Repeat
MIFMVWWFFLPCYQKKRYYYASTFTLLQGVVMHKTKKISRMKFLSLLFLIFSAPVIFAQSFKLNFAIDTVPSVFGPGTISDGLSNRDMALSPANDELFYTLQYGTQFNAILYSRKISGGWSKPEIAPFSGRYGDLEPAFSPDGKRLYFTSNRPLTDTGKEAKDFDLWYVDKKSSGWGEPVNMGAIINSTKDEFYASVAKNGNLYFTRDNDSAKDDIFLSTFKNGVYSAPVALGETVNSRGYDFNAFVDPDEKYMIFSSYKRSDDMGGGDLYISINNNGKWAPAVHMELPINSVALDYSPFVSFDKKYFFFSSRRSLLKLTPGKMTNLQEVQKSLAAYGNGNEDIYLVSGNILDQYLR